MADRFPLILNTSTNQIQEIPSGDNLDLTGVGINNVGVITSGNVQIGAATTDLVVTGDARITGILTVGTGSLTLNGPNNLVNVGTALTLGHTQGLQFHTQNLHSAGFEVNQINVSGASTIGGNLDANGDLDVDGHTNLDNVSVSGVSTFAGNVTTGNIFTVQGSGPSIELVDTNANDDFRIHVNHGIFQIEDATNGNADRLKIDSSGVVTIPGNTDFGAGVDVTGNITATGNVSGVDGTFTGNVSIGGTLTYEDVTNIDSVGIITARSGINLTGGNITLGDTSDGSSDDLLIFGAGSDLKIYHDSNHSYIQNATGDLFIKSNADDLVLQAADDVLIRPQNGEDGIKVIGNGAVELYFNNEVRCATSGYGANITGQSAAVSFNLYTAGGTKRGGLYATNANVISLLDGQDHQILRGVKDGTAELYFDNSKKLETTSTGIKVTHPSNNPDIKITGALGSGAEHRIFVAGSNSESLQITGNTRLFFNANDHHFRNAATTQDLFVITSNGDVNLPRDSKNLQIGAGQDLKLYHDGSNSYIKNSTNSLFINSAAHIYFGNADNSEYKAKFHNNGSVELYHDNSKKFETSSSGATVTGALSVTGDITVPTSMDSTTAGGVGIQRFWTASISAGNVYKCGQWHTGEGTVQLLIAVRSHTAGNSGTTTYMYQGGFSAIGSTGIARLLPLTVGTGHGNGPDNGTNSNAWELLIDNINNYTYAVYVHVPSGVANKNLLVTVTELGRGFTFTDLSSTVAYSSLTVQSSPILSSNINHFGHVYQRDNYTINLGNSNDLKLFHNGTNSFISNTSGILQIDSDSRVQVNATEFRVKNAGDTENIAKFIQDGACELYHNNVKKFETTSSGADVTGRLHTDGVFIGDGGNNDISLSIGANNDLRLYHDGSHSYIKDRGTGNLYIESNYVNIDTDHGEQMINCIKDGAVELFYNNSKQFETTSFGCQTVFSSGGGSIPIFKVLHGNLSQGIGFGYNSITAIGTNTNVDLYLKPKGTNPLYIQRDNGANMLRANPGAELILYHNGEETAQTYNTNGRKAFLVGDKAYINSGVTHGELIVRKNLSSPNNASIGQCARITVVTNEQTAGGNGYGGAVYFMGQDVSTSNQYAEYAAIGAKMHGSADLANTTPNCDFSVFTRQGSSFSEGFRVRYDGTIYAHNTTVQSLSDIRLKENIEDYSFDLNKFKQFKPISFNWKKPECHPTTESGRHRGFIAQDVQKLDSYLLTSEYDLDVNSEERELLDEDAIGLTSSLGDKDAMYVSVIQQMIDKIEKLETEVAALKGS